MPPDARDKALLFDMLEAASHLRKMWAERPREAARHVSPETKATLPAIEWRRIVGLRNVVVHDYDEIDYGRHWRVIQEDIPKLIAALEEALG